ICARTISRNSPAEGGANSVLQCELVRVCRTLIQKTRTDESPSALRHANRRARDAPPEGGGAAQRGRLATSGPVGAMRFRSRHDAPVAVLPGSRAAGAAAPGEPPLFSRPAAVRAGTVASGACA